MPHQEAELATLYKQAASHPEVMRYFEDKLITNMSQFSADSEATGSELSQFKKSLNNRNYTMIEQVLSLFDKKQLANLWQKRFEPTYIKKALAEVDREVQIVLGFLVSIVYGY